MQQLSIEAQIQAVGKQLQRLAGHAPPSLFDPRGLRGRVLQAAMRDAALRTALFQFVDVLPALASEQEIAEHFQSYLKAYANRLGGLWGRLFALGGLPVAASAVRRIVSRLARQFVAEERPESLQPVLAELTRLPAAVTLDAVGEAALSERECEGYTARYLALLDQLAAVPGLPGRPPVHLSIKLSALTARFDPLDYPGVRRRVFARLMPILARLRELGGGMTVDMEQYEFKPLTLRLFKDLVEAEGDGRWQAGIALQAYLKDTPEDLQDLLAWAEKRNKRLAVRLVKGAYWDTEVALARQRGWPVPVLLTKGATDAQYERLLDQLFARSDLVYPAVASHNLRSLAYAIAAADRRGLSASAWEIQMLYGMAEPLRHAVAAMGLALRVYLPVGELLPGIAYLIRRLIENTANTSILRHAYVEGAELDQLLAPPAAGEAPPLARPSGFVNLPLRDFSQAANEARFRQALERVRAKLGGRYLLAIPGAAPEGVGWTASCNPARPGEILGHVAVAGIAQAEQAVANARRAFPAWRDTPPAERAALCRKAAEAMAARRDELAAWQVLEVGKNWREADADVAEAVDYLRYYAGQMERLADWRETVSFPAERNHLRYEPRGVAVVISPWNFPLAILTGMTCAALVTGNTAIVKPASPANLVAYGLKEVLEEAGFPPGVCQFLPGEGPVIGEYLVKHPDVHLIAFTGSRAVGLEILQQAYTPAPEQRHVKQVIAEMGGKNAIVVDEDADLDEAVGEILHSAFGYQGQKCSACSRLIAVGRVHDRLVERLAAALDSHPYGPPEDPAFQFGPLIHAAARRKALGYIELGRREGRLYYLGRVPEDGHYCPPAIFTDIEPHHRLAREEIFGPILAVLRARSFKEALELALDSDYALTGGVFSRLPEHLELARERFRVGNLYLNRRITGARVGVQPFGGVRLSGLGVQAGGEDYLKQFLWTRVVSENTLRHGLVPDAP
ncbi:L-glutamate gamma-semialdehyde dehydrogenase [Methylothermus subterraneus]